MARIRREFVDPGPHLCYFRCGAVLESKFRDFEEVKRWRWFTGYGPEPVHFCPNCRVEHAQAIEQLKRILDVRPAGYPKVRVKVPPYRPEPKP